MDSDQKIKKVASKAASLDCSRVLDGQKRAVYKHLIKLLEEKKRIMKAEIAEKERNRIEKQGYALLLQERTESKCKYIECRRQYHADLVKRMALAEENRKNLGKRYQDMIEQAKEQWASYLEIYHRRPLAKKKIELRKKLSLVQFEALYEAQRQEDLENTIEKKKHTQSLIRETRERENARLIANIMSKRARLEELDRIKKEKEELFARLEAEIAEKDREEQRLIEMTTAGPADLPIPMITPPIIGQPTLPNYGFARQPLSCFSRFMKSSTAESKIVPSSSQSSVLMSFNRREINTRIIEGRRFVVVTSASVITDSSAPMNNRSAVQNTVRADDLVPLTRQETNTEMQMGTDDIERHLVDPDYAGSSTGSSQSSGREMFLKNYFTPEALSYQSQFQPEAVHGQIPASVAPLALPPDSSAYRYPQSTIESTCPVSPTQTSQLQLYTNDSVQPAYSTHQLPISARPSSQTRPSETASDQNAICVRSISQPQSNADHRSHPMTSSQEPVRNIEPTTCQPARMNSLSQVSYSSHAGRGSPALKPRTQPSSAPALTQTMNFVSPVPSTPARSTPPSLIPASTTHPNLASTTHPGHASPAPMTHPNLTPSTPPSHLSEAVLTQPSVVRLLPTSVYQTPSNLVHGPPQAHMAPASISESQKRLSLASPTVPGHGFFPVLPPRQTPPVPPKNGIPASSVLRHVSPVLDRAHEHIAYVPLEKPALNPSQIATSQASPELSNSSPNYAVSEPVPGTPTPATANMSSQPMRTVPVPAMAPSIHTRMETTLQALANNESPSPIAPSQEQTFDEQHPKDVRETQAGISQADNETSRYFDKSHSSEAYQQAVVAHPKNGPSHIVNETYSDHGSKTSEGAPDFQNTRSPDSDFDVACPRFSEGDSTSPPPHHLLTSPTSPQPPPRSSDAAGTGFGDIGTGYSFPSIFQNLFSGSSSSNNAASATASGQSQGMFDFSQAPSRNPFKLF